MKNKPLKVVYSSLIFSDIQQNIDLCKGSEFESAFY